MAPWSDERKAGMILTTIALGEGWWLFFTVAQLRPHRFLRYTGFIDGRAGPAGWLLGLGVFALFTWRAAQFPSVRANLFAVSGLKVLALAVAVTAGFCEETIFRKWLMDALLDAHAGLVLQVIASAIVFGLLHGIWGAFRGSLATAVGATAATGVLGGALALVYVAGHRSLAPCIVAHLLINAVAEPGLVLAAVRGEMSARAPAQARN